MSMRKNAEWILIEPFQMSLDKMLTPFGGLQQLCSITLYIIQHKSFCISWEIYKHHDLKYVLLEQHAFAQH